METPVPTILVADDHWTEVGPVLTTILDGYDVVFEARSDRVLAILEGRPGIVGVLLDLQFDDQPLQGRELLYAIKKQFPPLPVFILTARNEADLAMQLTRREEKAADYFEKEKLGPQIAPIVRRYVEQYRADQKIDNLRLIFHPDSREVTIGECLVKLDYTQYALYRTVAQAAQEQWPGVGANGFGADQKGWIPFTDFYDHSSRAARAFLDTYEASFTSGIDRAQNLRRSMSGITAPLRKGAPTPQDLELHKTLQEGFQKEIQEKITQGRSKFNAKLRQVIRNAKVEHRFMIHQEDQRRGTVKIATYGLLLRPSHIVFETSS